MPNFTIWRVLFVDDDEEFCKEASELLDGFPIDDNGNSLSLKSIENFNDVVDCLESEKFDLLILDVKFKDIDDKKGSDVLDHIKTKYFIPTIFYTAVPTVVRDKEGPFVRVVEKTKGFPQVIEVIKDIFSTDILQIRRSLSHYLDAVQRDYMWPFVSEHWSEYVNQNDRLSLAYLLSMRLAAFFSGPAIQELADDLSNSLCQHIVEDAVHPIQYYVMPPVNPTPLAGDIYQERSTDKEGEYCILLTPSCDLAHDGKADQILLASCLPLIEQAEYKCWHDNQSGTKKKDLVALLKNQRHKAAERYHYLPGVFSLPDLVVDFQRIQSFPVSELENKFSRLASLSSPFAESLISRFNRYFGRLGTPDLDTEIVLNKFINQALKCEK